MKVYVISDIVVTDQEKYNEYMKLAPNTIARYGGKYLVRGGNILNSLDWNPKGRIIVLEFPSKDKLDQWQNSEEYKPVKEIRLEASSSKSIIIESGDLPF